MARRPPQRNQKDADTRADTPIPLWPGILVTAVCGIIFLAAGVGRFGFKASKYSHHTLTAYAWTKGRLYLQRDELQRMYYVDWFKTNLKQQVAESESTAALRQRYMKLNVDNWRKRGFSDQQIQSQLQRLENSGLHDWVQIEDRCYAYWPPVPAAILFPLVLIFGTGFSDIFLTGLLATASVWFMYLAVRALKPHWPDLTTTGCAALAVFYGIGTCHFYQGTIGQVWYVTQLCGSLFLVIAIWLGIVAVQRPAILWLAGAALGLGFLSRNTIILAAPFFAVMLWIAVRGASDWMLRFVKYGSGFAVALIIAIGIQFGFNNERFGDPLDFGQGRLADAGGNPRFAEEFKEHGRFNLYYLPRNVMHYFLHIPWPWPIEFASFKFTPRRHPQVAGWTYTPMGDSLFFTSPAMFYLFLCARQKRRDLLIAVLAGLIPGTAALMLFHGTGWYQFGQRYLLDTMAFFVLLAGFGMRGRLTAPGGALIALSIAVNAWGAYRFGLEQPP